jgi:hypothetical protein
MGKIWTVEEEAQRLRARFDDVPNKAAWAREHGLPGGPSMLNQHIHGHRPMNMDAALVYMAGFRVRLDEISPRLAKVMYAALRQLEESKQVDKPTAPPELPPPVTPEGEENLALTLAVAFQEEVPDPRGTARLVDG